MPVEGARFGHVNLTSHDWRRLAAFYTEVFGCTFVPPERDIKGPVLDAATGLVDAHLTGAHLRLPGHGDAAPTLEIFSYEALADAAPTRVDRPGLGHIAFAVSDVPTALESVQAAGGGRVGEVVTTATADGRQVTWCYATDPDGNIVELQAWSSVPPRRLRVTAELANVADVRALVRGAVDAIDPTADEACQDDLVQAVDEAATNVILHGYAGAAGWIDVSIDRLGDRLVVTLEDEAPLFDPTSVPEPDLSVPPEARTPGGLGVHLIRAATDEIRHSPRAGGGNILTLSRRLDRRPKEER